MHSQQDFETLNQYRDYLRDYYAGMALIPLINDRTLSHQQIIQYPKEYAEEIVKQLYGDWT